LISSAKKTIDITTYELTDTTVTSEFAKAAANGVAVRVVLDQNSEKQSNTTAYNYLASHKVSVHWANPTYAVTHQKTITVDQATTAIMTLNLTPQDYATTRDFAYKRVLSRWAAFAAHKAVLDKVLKAGICGGVERKARRQRFGSYGFSSIDQPKVLGLRKRLVPGSNILVSLFSVRFDVCVCSRIRTCDGYLDLHAVTPL
jgi:hypothetical protein